jgi:hypothetical protein
MVEQRNGVKCVGGGGKEEHSPGLILHSILQRRRTSQSAVDSRDRATTQNTGSSSIRCASTSTGTIAMSPLHLIPSSAATARPTPMTRNTRSGNTCSSKTSGSSSQQCILSVQLLPTSLLTYLVLRADFYLSTDDFISGLDFNVRMFLYLM